LLPYNPGVLDPGSIKLQNGLRGLGIKADEGAAFANDLQIPTFIRSPHLRDLMIPGLFQNELIPASGKKT
jgi:hypothetical protein